MAHRSGAFTGANRDKPDSRDYHVNFSSLTHLIEHIPKFSIYDDKITLERLRGDFVEIASPFKLHLFNQLDANTCVPCAIGIAYKCLTERYETTDEGFIPSRLFLYYVARLMRLNGSTLHPDKADVPHRMKDGQDEATWLASLVNDPPHIEEQIDVDDGSSPRDLCMILKHLGCCQERSMYESGAGYPERDMWEPGWKPDTAGSIDGKPWWPYFEADDSIPKGRNLEPYFRDFWWKGYNLMRAPNGPKDSNGDPIDTLMYPSGSLGQKPPSSTAFTSAKKHKALNFSHPGDKDLVDRVAEWKVAIKFGFPVIFMFWCNVTTYYQDYKKFKDNGWKAERLPANGNKDFLHCVLAVGWDDDQRCFRIQDSYGSEEYDKGFWWMPYEWLRGDNKISMIDHGDVWILHEGSDSVGSTT